MSVSDKGDMQNVQSNGSRGTRLKITGLLDSVHPGKEAGNITFHFSHGFGSNYNNNWGFLHHVRESNSMICVKI